MKKTTLILLLSILGLTSYAQSLKVEIKQDGKVIKPVNNVYELKKSTFQFDIAAKNVEGFLVGVTTDENHYGEAVDFFEPNDPWFENTGMAEGLFNEEQELFLTDMAPSYWYYSDRDDHRFDRDPKGTPQKWTATRTVKKIYDIVDAQEVALADVETSLFIYMYDPVYNDEYDMVSKKSLFFAELKFID